MSESAAAQSNDVPCAKKPKTCEATSENPAHKHEFCGNVMIPYLTAADTRATINFYQEAFGFVWKNEAEKGGAEVIDHVEMKYKDQYVMFSREGAFGSDKKTPKNMGITLPMNLYLYCEDVDALWEQATKAGAEGLMPPNDAFWGDRVCLVKDIDGYEWMFATHK